MNGRKLLSFVLLIGLTGLQLLSQPKPLTVDDVVQLVKLGMGDDVVIARIQKNGQPFDLSTDDMIKLKQAGASSAVIKTMMNPGAAPAAPPAPVAAPLAAPPAAAQGIPTEMGVYAKKGAEWVEVLPEVVNWKSGGVLKSMATVGVVKGDINGNINGPNSRNALKTPLEFIIVTAEGVAITEYQLIKLRASKSNREFRTVTGGVFHVSGGANRDLQPFEGKKVDKRAYSVILPPTLGIGEFGFLPPGAYGSANSASIGKMYTFRVIE